MATVTLCAGLPMEKTIDMDTLFPPIESDNIAVMLSGGVESALLLHLVNERYNATHTIIPISAAAEDRRSWEVTNAVDMVSEMTPHLSANMRTHVEESYETYQSIRDSYYDYDRNITSTNFYNQENRGIMLMLEFVGLSASTPAFTGKNWSTLDPELITPQENEVFQQYFNVFRPFLSLYKEHTVAWCIDVGIDVSSTHSCQMGAIHCGLCHACWDRQQAFKKIGVTDSTPYINEQADLTPAQLLEYNAHFTQRANYDFTQ